MSGNLNLTTSTFYTEVQSRLNAVNGSTPTTELVKLFRSSELFDSADYTIFGAELQTRLNAVVAGTDNTELLKLAASFSKIDNKSQEDIQSLLTNLSTLQTSLNDVPTNTELVTALSPLASTLDVTNAVAPLATSVELETIDYKLEEALAQQNKGLAIGDIVQTVATTTESRLKLLPLRKGPRVLTSTEQLAYPELTMMLGAEGNKFYWDSSTYGRWQTPTGSPVNVVCATVHPTEPIIFIGSYNISTAQTTITRVTSATSKSSAPSSNILTGSGKVRQIFISADGSTLVVILYDGSQYRIYKSTDGGATLPLITSQSQAQYYKDGINFNPITGSLTFVTDVNSTVSRLIHFPDIRASNTFTNTVISTSLLIYADASTWDQKGFSVSPDGTTIIASGRFTANVGGTFFNEWYISRDSGSTWSVLDLPQTQYLVSEGTMGYYSNIQIDPYDSDVMVLTISDASYYTNLTYYTTDGGITWGDATAELPAKRNGVDYSFNTISNIPESNVNIYFKSLMSGKLVLCGYTQTYNYTSSDAFKAGPVVLYVVDLYKGSQIVDTIDNQLRSNLTMSTTPADGIFTYIGLDSTGATSEDLHLVAIQKLDSTRHAAFKLGTLRASPYVLPRVEAFNNNYKIVAGTLPAPE